MATVGGDLEAVIKVSAWVIASMTYARLASSSTKPGILRLFALQPVIFLLPFFPWYFTSIHLRGTSAFFLAWLGVFKLLLLSFDAGPLSLSLPLPTFIAIASLPVKIRPANKSAYSPRLLLVSCTQLVLLLLITPLYLQYKSQIHPWLLLAINCLQIYLLLELVLASGAFLAASLLGLGIEPQADAPFKSASLQEFWGRRWNLIVSGILRPSVYQPVKSRFGPAGGVMATFLVSGLMHEVMFYYLTLQAPTGEVTLFFLIHGICTVAEAKARRAGWWDPHPLLAVPLTLGFVAATAFWLFFPPLLRSGADEKGVEELAVLLRMLEGGGGLIRRLVTG